MKVFEKFLWFSALVLCLCGCHSLDVTSPKRSSAEQLLLSTAVDHSLTNANVAMLHGRRVYVVEQYFESYDQPYALGAIREWLSVHGALLVDHADDADTIVEARAGGLGIDKRTTLFGIPEIPIPIPLAGTFSTPEIALYKSTKADAVGKFALLAYDREERTFTHSTDFSGTARFHHYKLLGVINWRRTDIPEFNPEILDRFKDEDEF